MKVLITGANGFIGQNLKASLEEIRDGHDCRPDHILFDGGPADLELRFYHHENALADLEDMCSDCDFVFHLAGISVSRPQEGAEFWRENQHSVDTLLKTLKRCGNPCRVMLASSVKASLAGAYHGSVYGQSKLASEKLVFQYAEETGAEVFVYRFPNVFGKWCRPNHNSVVATFCHNIANGLPIRIDNPDTELNLVYIDDVIDELLRTLGGRPTRAGSFCRVPVHYNVTLSRLAELIQSFPQLQERAELPSLDDPLVKKLYATYLSHLPEAKMVHDLATHEDPRGSFTELVHMAGYGQFSLNVSRPGATKGNHWHHTKVEQFLVLRGDGLVQLRRAGRQPDGRPWPQKEFRLSGLRPQVVEIPPGYTHNIVNLSQTEDLVTLIWASETFDPSHPDTFFQEV